MFATCFYLNGLWDLLIWGGPGRTREQKVGVLFDSHKVSRTAVITPLLQMRKTEPQCRYWPEATWLTSDGGVDSRSLLVVRATKNRPLPQIHHSLPSALSRQLGNCEKVKGLARP